jgi:integrase
MPRYLFQRPDSQNWWIKLQAPSNITKSLGTNDRRQAEILALPLIQAHKEALLAARPRFESAWIHAFEPGREHVGPKTGFVEPGRAHVGGPPPEIAPGERVFATDRELFYLDANGKTVRTAPNGALGFQVAIPRNLTRGQAKAIVRDLDALGLGHKRPVLATKNGDDSVLETYLQHAGVTGAKEREARHMWEIWRTIAKVSLKDASRDDGRKLIEYLKGQRLKSATIRRKFVPLVAAVNLAMAEGRLKFNPFAGLAHTNGDATEKVPFDEADMAIIKSNLHRLSESDQLLLRLLATTGMRASEPFQIEKELVEDGIRYAIITRRVKTKASKRRVPLPAFVPAVTGPLFQGDSKMADRRLNLFLRRIGITDKEKSVHSFRHRAYDRLRAAGCPEQIQKQLLGHAKTVSESYGKGHPVPLLKQWIDKIGF